LRQFAAARLAATGELAMLHARHATHYLALAERAAPHLTGPEQAVWCDRLDSDLDNLRAALGWARQAGAAEFEPRLAGALGRFWSNRGYLAEGRDWLEAALALPDAVANVARRRGDLAEAAALHRQALQFKVSVGQRRQIAITLEDLAMLAVAEGHGEHAARLLGAATALRAAIGAPMAVPEQQTLEREIGTMRATLGDAAWAVAFAAGSALPLDAVVAAALAPVDSTPAGAAEAEAF
jgi:hypothetical protein